MQREPERCCQNRSSPRGLVHPPGDAGGVGDASGTGGASGVTVMSLVFELELLSMAPLLSGQLPSTFPVALSEQGMLVGLLGLVLSPFCV
jgi:hypothetical protein